MVAVHCAEESPDSKRRWRQVTPAGGDPRLGPQKITASFRGKGEKVR